jgi:hypothetical protein
MQGDPAPPAIYGQLPSVFVIDAVHSDFVFHYWSPDAQDFGYIEFLEVSGH